MKAKSNYQRLKTETVPLPQVEGACCPSTENCDGFAVLRTKVVPADKGDGTTGEDKVATGKHKNLLVSYEADSTVYIYDSAGVYTNLKEAGPGPYADGNGIKY